MIIATKKAFSSALNCDHILGLVNLLAELTSIKFRRDSAGNIGDFSLIKDLITSVKDPLKSVLSKHHFERSKALETLAILIEFVASTKDRETIVLVESCFISKLYFKSNEPESLQI